ncbi:MAG: DUF3500 domain-containing protein [Dehalococcoidia bacterium]
MATHATPAPSHAPDVVRVMSAAAATFLDSFSAEQREKATFPFEGEERYKWAYTPIDRNGLLLSDMSQAQRDLAFSLMNTAYSRRGIKTAQEIIQLETILGEWEEMQGARSQWSRDLERYWFSVFGTPGSVEPWGWRVGGHHIGLHITIVNGEQVSVLPLFFGANPAEVRHGPHKGKRTLAEEEDVARDLLAALSPDQKKIAIVDPVAPDDILTKNYRVADPSAAPRGLALQDMGDQQRDILVGLIRHYVERAEDHLASNYWKRVESDGLDGLTFAWAGPEERGEGHYYAIQGPLFVIEYDNTQNGANHIHSVLRDFTHDWGEDLLAAHYDGSHHG